MAVENSIIRLGADVAELKREVKVLSAELLNFRWRVLKSGLMYIEPRDFNCRVSNRFDSAGVEFKETANSVKRSIESLKFWALGTSTVTVLCVNLIVDLMMR
jgi:hypothetical protein